MSRVTEALRKAAGLAPESEPFRDDEQWGQDLSEAEIVPVAPPKPFEPRRAVVARAAAERPAGRPSATAIRSEVMPPAGISESMRPHLAALIERVFQPATGEPIRAVALTGVGVESGAITATTAEMLAQQTGANVCVIDANLASPSLHHHFGVAGGVGLIEAIEGGTPFTDVAREVRPHLWLISAGTPGGIRPGFASDAVRLQMSECVSRFDYVLVDIEPVTGLGAAVGLAPLVSGVILVVGADATRRESARQATQVLQTAGAAVIGAVLTNRRFPIPEALYRRL
jgi:Mrp family chromosome partitioning ATPase